MGKIRQSRKDLPQRVYFKHGSYYFVNHANKWIPLGKEYGLAMQKWASMLEMPVGKLRMSSVIDAYIMEEVPNRKPKTKVQYLNSIKVLRPVFADMWPEDVEPKNIYSFMRLRGAPIAANRDVAVLSNIMNHAVKMGLVNVNPCKQVRRNPAVARTREVLDAEIVALLPHCPVWLQCYIKLKLLTGLRQGDLLNIRLDQLREDGLYVETGKTGKRLLFTWDDNLRKAINDIKALRHRVTSLYLFNSPRDGTPMTQSSFKGSWSKYMRAAMKEGSIIERFAENDLRAKVATEAIGLGQNASVMLGHSSDAVTRKHYIRGTQTVAPLGKKY